MWFSVILILLILHGQHTEGPLKSGSWCKAFYRCSGILKSSCSAFGFCKLDGLCLYGKMIDSIPINTDLLLKTMVPECYVVSDFLLLPSNHLETSLGWKTFAVCIAAPSSSSGQKEKGQRFLSLKLVNTGRQHVITQLLIFSCCLQNLGIQNISLCCALGSEQTWLCSRCRSLDSPDSTDQGLIFISCTRKKDKDKEIKEAHFFAHVPA